MWIEVGHYAAILALLLSVVQIVVPIVGLRINRPAWIRVGRHCAIIAFLLLTISSAALVHAFLTHDFTVLYVASNSSLELPIFYLATAMWGGHEGSLLLWAWLLSMFIAIAAWRHWNTHPVSMPWVLAILAAVLIGFLMLVLFLSSPFERLFPAPLDGRDLNPLLQDPGMVFHPPFLYLGYVGFAVPYAFAMSALITGQASGEWILATRRWTLFAWAMLTTGIIFGGYWAYYELGWGGYWAWDPVENASFMPWLTGTAFLHSIMVQERRDMFKVWNLFLIITTFALSLLGTFLVRSGVLSSVHAFATDPGRGSFILIFMGVMLILSFGVLIMRSDILKTENRMNSLLCRESTFLFNNLFLLVGAVTVLLGTLYPLAVETFAGAKVTVGPPYFNKVFIPIMLGLLMLMGMGPLISWRRASKEQMKKNFFIPAILAIVGIPTAFFFSIDHPYAVVTVMLIFFVSATHGLDFQRSVAVRMKNGGSNVVTTMFQMISRNKRRYGGLTVHIGILVMSAGFIGSGMFQDVQTVIMQPGDSTKVAHWNLTMEKMHKVRKYNWVADEAVIKAVRDDGLELTLHPQKRTYNNHTMQTTEAAIKNFVMEDLYIVLGDRVPGKGWAIKAYRNPLVNWVWYGSGIMAFGALLALMQGRQLRKTKRAKA
uniref:Cytochrome c-type biogenesis protein ccmF n=1 Tax=Magnetococcus massalia (strain MO-1) TaxID=451514 RepID=A0A1S7LLV9_MAGMO|nr:Cytochrome c-type biogenesis protein ccmF [Candidatus Magnetococcus massalia]